MAECACNLCAVCAIILSEGRRYSDQIQRRSRCVCEAGRSWLYILQTAPGAYHRRESSPKDQRWKVTILGRAWQDMQSHWVSPMRSIGVHPNRQATISTRPTDSIQALCGLSFAYLHILPSIIARLLPGASWGFSEDGKLYTMPMLILIYSLFYCIVLSAQGLYL